VVVCYKPTRVPCLRTSEHTGGPRPPWSVHGARGLWPCL